MVTRTRISVRLYLLCLTYSPTPCPGNCQSSFVSAYSALPVAPPLVAVSSTNLPLAPQHKYIDSVFPAPNSLQGCNLQCFLTSSSPYHGFDLPKPCYPITSWQDFVSQQPDWLPHSSQEPITALTVLYALPNYMFPAFCLDRIEEGTDYSETSLTNYQ